MRVSRHKKFQRYLTFFKQQFYFQPPYKILVDGTLAQAALAMKVNLKEQLPKYFEENCRIIVTPCTLIETERLGPTLYGAVQVLKGLQLFKCPHAASPIPASSCLKSLVRKLIPKSAPPPPQSKQQNEDEKHFIVATQDPNLREHFRKVIGVPLMYLHGNAPTLEKPSDASYKWTVKRDKKKLEVTTYQKEILKQMKEDLLPGSNKPDRKGTRKRKRAGPNPLSCKKAKKHKGQQQQDSHQQSSSRSVEAEQPKKRKRIRLKVPKHVKELVNKADY